MVLHGWFYPSEKRPAPLEVAAQAGGDAGARWARAVAPSFPVAPCRDHGDFVKLRRVFRICSYGAPDVLRYVMGSAALPDSATGPDGKFWTEASCSPSTAVSTGWKLRRPQIRTSQEVAVATAIDTGQVSPDRWRTCFH